MLQKSKEKTRIHPTILSCTKDGIILGEEANNKIHMPGEYVSRLVGQALKDYLVLIVILCSRQGYIWLSGHQQRVTQVFESSSLLHKN